MHRKLTSLLLFAIFAVRALTACTPAAGEQTEAAPETGAQLNVVATTTVIADVVSEIAGENVQVISLLPPGTDPHSFQPTPQDVAKVADADLIFANGLGLEEFMASLLENSGTQADVITVNEGVPLLKSEDVHQEEEHEEPHPEETGVDADPHTWFDPNNVILWAQNIERGLSQADPTNAESYAANAERYQEELRQLHAWIQEQVDRVPPDERRLVTDHTVFTYFADRYNFAQIGAVIPSYSTLSEPSAQEIARLEDTIRQFEVPAIFVGESVNPGLSERIAEDTGIQVVFVHTGSLSQPQGSAPTYIEMMRINVNGIVGALN